MQRTGYGIAELIRIDTLQDLAIINTFVLALFLFSSMDWWMDGGGGEVIERNVRRLRIGNRGFVSSGMYKFKKKILSPWKTVLVKPPALAPGPGSSWKRSPHFQTVFKELLNLVRESRCLSNRWPELFPRGNFILVIEVLALKSYRMSDSPPGSGENFDPFEGKKRGKGHTFSNFLSTILRNSSLPSTVLRIPSTYVSAR